MEVCIELGEVVSEIVREWVSILLGRFQRWPLTQKVSEAAPNSDILFR